MRRLVIVAFVFPLLAGCGWPFSGGSSVATHGPSVHGCSVMTPHGPMPCRSASTVRLAGGGVLTDDSTDSYVAFGSFAVSATEGPVEFAVPSGFSTMTGLQVSVLTAPGGGASWTLTVDKNGSATVLTCSIAGVATSCRDSSVVPVVAGDKIDLDVTPFGSPALTTITWLAAMLRPDLP